VKRGVYITTEIYTVCLHHLTSYH